MNGHLTCVCCLSSVLFPFPVHGRTPSYTTTGSFSRSAINNSCGAKTPLSGFVTSMIVMCVLLFLTPIFKLLPYNVMGAIIITGATGGCLAGRLVCLFVCLLVGCLV
jgi:hypothetical protein